VKTIYYISNNSTCSCALRRQDFLLFTVMMERENLITGAVQYT